MYTMLKSLKSAFCIRRILSVTMTKKYTIQSFKPFYKNLLEHANNISVIDRSGQYKYRDILYTSFLIAKQIEDIIPSGFETGKTISFLCPNEAIYVSVLLACWISGNIAVPLSTSHPETLLEYVITNSESSVVISTDSVSSTAQNIASKLNVSHFTVSSVTEDPSENFDVFHSSKFFSWDSNFSDRKALIIYTSGTTGAPKGVVLTHGNLFAQISSLVKAWEITSQDVILHTLPLYHMHGIMNALLCLLNVGGTVVMRPKFNATEVWNYLTSQDNLNYKISLFYGVPTMYVMLIEEFHKNQKQKHCAKDSCQENIRLMTSGSAPLPEPVFYDWESITGHFLLERFGMSEIGMALSNPLHGPRIPGSVGKPLPGVEVKIVKDSSSNELETLVEGNASHVKVFSNCVEGELLIRGPTVFKEYWNNEKATFHAFTDCGWFKTGDVATYKNSSFKILGRISADIIKSGGYKISALPIESHLLSHPEISDCAVMGIPDEKWGERVAALLVTGNKKELSISELKAWCEETLPAYSVPSVIKYIDAIPRNPMGKMNKKELKKIFS